VRLVRIRSIEKSNDHIGIRTRDLPPCSVVPQPTTLPVCRKYLIYILYFLLFCLAAQSRNFAAHPLRITGLENVGASTSHNPMVLHACYRDSFNCLPLQITCLLEQLIQGEIQQEERSFKIGTLRGVAI
jgi:hypothetical protein